MQFFIFFIAALFCSMLVMKPVIAFAKKIDFQEKPRPDIPRKLHKEPKPYLASVPMFIIYWALLFVSAESFSLKTAVVFGASLIILLIGLWDDWYKINYKDLPALPKLVVQFIACVLVFSVGVRFVGFTNPFTGTFILLPLTVQFIFTILWIFGITTIINFSDGMDGLAGGLCFIASSSLFVVALINGDAVNALACIILAGTCLGYLKYNKYPSLILMGDSGATFLGFMLATIALDGVFKQATVISLVVPILIFALPIFDNLYVMFLRYKNKQPLHIGDANQMHFRLHLGGISQKLTVYFMYLISACLSLVAIILMLITKTTSLALFGLVIW
ncbi:MULTISPECIES: MraY family glycosyltransferase [unclassified Fusibacter]|uniref:MraY family glycosyltransferase n=1 Tax=unclassified Fusibacter TaxID=2624464 RepID=UPI001010A744|nr:MULTISPECIES: MraY family glycosyltransferase [unclassified Fusibacter]MCK8060750.1 undecaprenyl/decaprenyl-phosphate alpha-N-acetylglucosaminyl 1-phosphate transferase [Fusibacter sp. A2]NPE23046.1 undecaprenyl/decaprenyl-phosphate alpha-N-acetylglucosaminyl 1-phosphate transferase [Fusibacter sp. A1]RXV59718.1 undecaprenyl/decaprenyl-phosphate alpha-N-acetylglucosaminyl 1-phosphate transferase [Fusibacter sp. A1]